MRQDKPKEETLRPLNIRDVEIQLSRFGQFVANMFGEAEDAVLAGSLILRKDKRYSVAAKISCVASRNFGRETTFTLYESELIGPAYAVDDISKEPYLPKKGWLEIPKGYGLGIEIDEGKMEKYRVELKR